MDTYQAIASALGLSFLAGIRLYLTVLLVGAGIHFGYIHPSGAMSHLAILGDTRVLIASGIATAIEFVADKVPWVDSAWDTVHTFIRPIGAAMLGATALWHVDPALQVLIVLLCGGLALSGHSTKAATRLAVNHVPEPFSNIGLSLMGDLAVPAGLWLVFAHPWVMAGALLVFVLLFAWLAPKIFRRLRNLFRVVRRHFSATSRPVQHGAALPR